MDIKERMARWIGKVVESCPYDLEGYRGICCEKELCGAVGRGRGDDDYYFQCWLDYFESQDEDDLSVIVATDKGRIKLEGDESVAVSGHDPFKLEAVSKSTRILCYNACCFNPKCAGAETFRNLHEAPTETIYCPTCGQRAVFQIIFDEDEKENA